MKREFLQGLQVEGSPLPKEVIDAIMAENGRDIEAVKARFAELDGAAGAWEEKYNQALTSWLVIYVCIPAAYTGTDGRIEGQYRIDGMTRGFQALKERVSLHQHVLAAQMKALHL